MKTQHTPAPWKITYSTDGKETLINRGHVASVELDDNEQGEANARLISAAPELLEALDSILRWMPSVEHSPVECRNDIEKAKAAIEKAKGKSQ